MIGAPDASVMPKLSSKSPSTSSNKNLYSKSVTSGKSAFSGLASMTTTAKIERFSEPDQLVKLLGLNILPEKFSDGASLAKIFQFTSAALEKEIEKALTEFINTKGLLEISSLPFKCQAYTQAQTFDGGILDIVVYDEMVHLEGTGASVNKLKPGRPICLIEVKKTGSLKLEEVLEQALGYARTIIGRHAGLEALPVVMLSGDSFYFAVVHWEDFATLKVGLCTKCFELTGEESKDNFTLLHSLLIHPAVIRPRRVTMEPVPWLKHLPDRIPSELGLLLISPVAVGSSSTAYIATDDLSRAKASDIPQTSPMETRGSIPLPKTYVIKFFRDYNEYFRELYVLGYLQLQREDFGPRIFGRQDGAILYERLQVAEQNIFYNESALDLNLGHFPHLLSEVRFMHSHGIVHQDLRSANIGFRGKTPVLMDFSFASVAPDSLLRDFRRHDDRKFPIRSMPSGYFGTRETASDRIMDLKARNENVDIPVTMHDDLCSLMKLWYLTCPGVQLPDTVKDWRELKSFWWLFFPLEEMAKMSPAKLAAKLEYIFRTRSTDTWEEPENKRMKPSML